jgi:DNA polymerase III subunit delta'
MAESTSGASVVYPWHHTAWQALARDATRLPHGILLQGGIGLGKRDLALRLAHSLLCRARGGDGAACGTCKSCVLLAAGNHPDLAVVGPIDDSKVITVDQVRALVDFLVLKPHTAERKVVVLAPAEAMNVNAANSLLKILEEPPLGSYLILVTSRPARLAATIRSRCTQVTIRPPARTEATAWLRTRPGVERDHELLLDLAGGAPLLAEAYARGGFLDQRNGLLRDVLAIRERRESPVTCAARWKTIGASVSLAWLHGLACDILRVTVAGTDSRLANPDQKEQLQLLGNHLDLKALYKFLDVVSESLRQLTGPVDELLTLEDTLIRWSQLATR